MGPGTYSLLAGPTSTAATRPRAATATAFHGRCAGPPRSEGRDGRLGDRGVLLAVAAADAHRADDLAVALERDAAGEDHDTAPVGLLDAVELATGLRIGTELGRRQVERPRRERLVDRDVDAADPRAVHAHVRDEVAAGVDDRDVLRLPDLARALLSGGRHAAGILERHGSLRHRCRACHRSFSLCVRGWWAPVPPDRQRGAGLPAGAVA